MLWIVSEEAPRIHLVEQPPDLTGPGLQGGQGSSTSRRLRVAGRTPRLRSFTTPTPTGSPRGRAISPAGVGGDRQTVGKVNINDSDHSYFGMWNDTPRKNRNYLWENFPSGNQVLFMDPYVVHYPRQRRNLCLDPVHGIGSSPRPTLATRTSGTTSETSCGTREG